MSSSPVKRKIQSPSTPTKLKEGVEKSIGSPIAISDSLGFALQRRERGTPPAMTLKRADSPRKSIFVENLEGSNGDKDRSAAVGKGGETALKVVDWPLGTPSHSPLLASSIDGFPRISPSETSRAASPSLREGTPLATVISPPAGKESRLGFLPNFFGRKVPRLFK